MISTIILTKISFIISLIIGISHSLEYTIEPPSTLNQFLVENNKLLKPKEIQMKFLFADALFSYNLNNLALSIFDTTNDNNNHHDHSEPLKSFNQTTYITSNLLPGSFICFILVKNDMQIEMIGIDEEKFKLEFEIFGSTSLLIKGKNKQRTKVFNLYSLKLQGNLNAAANRSGRVYVLQFNLIDVNNNGKFAGFSSWLKINVTDSEEIVYER